jgi:uncharacterized membrane protein
MDEGCFWVIAILFGLVVAIYVVFPITVALLAVIAGAGVLSGAGVAARNFTQVLIEAHRNER